MQNFVHNMKFSKTKGFSQVNRVNIEENIKDLADNKSE